MCTLKAGTTTTMKETGYFDVGRNTMAGRHGMDTFLPKNRWGSKRHEIGP